MNKSSSGEKSQGSKEYMKEIVSELQDLENEYVEVNGLKLRPSQCYYISDNPFHILYNTNCPDHLKHKVELILEKWQSQAM